MRDSSYVQPSPQRPSAPRPMQQGPAAVSQRSGLDLTAILPRAAAHPAASYRHLTARPAVEIAQVASALRRLGLTAKPATGFPQRRPRRYALPRMARSLALVSFALLLIVRPASANPPEDFGPPPLVIGPNTTSPDGRLAVGVLPKRTPDCDYTFYLVSLPERALRQPLVECAGRRFEEGRVEARWTGDGRNLIFQEGGRMFYGLTHFVPGPRGYERRSLEWVTARVARECGERLKKKRPRGAAPLKHHNSEWNFHPPDLPNEAYALAGEFYETEDGALLGRCILEVTLTFGGGDRPRMDTRPVEIEYARPASFD